MKNILISTLIIGLSLSLLAQAPQYFSYQSVIRDQSGQIISDSPVSLRISILRESINGSVSYQESHFLSTNEFGLVSIKIGTGTLQLGQLDTINWGQTDHYIRTEMDINGGANYVLMGTSQLISVPYALYGRDEDYDPINEIQSLTYQNDSLYISESNSIPLTQGFLGEVRMFAISLSGAVSKEFLQSKGWAICDGSTSESQGIQNPVILQSPDLQYKFIRMSNSETSGAIGGTEAHNHQWAEGVTANFSSSSESIGAGGYPGSGYFSNQHFTQSFNTSGTVEDVCKDQLGSTDAFTLCGDWYTNNIDTKPPYYELVFFIKVK